MKHCTPLRRREEREKGKDSEGGTVDEGGEGEKKEEKEIRVGSKEFKENILTEPVKEGRLPLCLSKFNQTVFIISINRIFFFL